MERSWTALGGNHHVDAFTVLAAAYAEPHRHYHTAEHIEHCLHWLDAYPEAASPAVEVALYFHDAVYVPGAQDNEARSAETFAQLARQAGIAADVVGRIAGLIISTAGHAAHDADAELLSDLDLAILGASPAEYARFEVNVRREYARFDETVFRKGRSRVLRGFLERSCIFQTSWFSARLEMAARQNLAHALNVLHS